MYRKIGVIVILFLFSLSASADLVGYWSFNGSDSIVNDAAIDTSGQGNDGTIYGAVAVAGKMGQALSFDGINDYVRVANDNSLNFGTGDFSICAWINTNSDTARQSIIVKGIPLNGTTNAGYLVSYRGDMANDPIFFTINDDDASGAVIIKYNTSGIANSWVHICCVADRDGNGSIYVNGELKASSSIAGITTDVSINADLAIGQTLSGGGPIAGRYFNGLIDEVRIYNEALTQDEVTTLYQLGRNVKMNSNFAGKIRMTPSKSGKLKFGEE